MKAAGIIPARYASTRFPGKPLALIHGVSMIERVYRRAKQAKMLDEVIVATDDERIYNHVTSFGGKAVMTSEAHLSGTDRCAEASLKLPGNYNVVINIQGDEPYIHPEQIDLLVNCFIKPEVELATLVKTITDPLDLLNTNIPKVVIAASGFALYFSRNTVPYSKPGETEAKILQNLYYKHIGIYGFRTGLLLKLAALPEGKLEQCESLEQLRWLEHGFKIFTTVSMHENIAVDAPSDIKLIESRFSVSD
jgi:3-deoxy-manno-octulosonate cytidylyltransferase (CMP-KDO synthetase)